VRRITILAAILLALLCPSHTCAQGVTLAASYQFSEAPGDAVTLPIGWLVSVGGSSSRIVTPVAEVGAAYRQDGNLLEFWTAQGGARFFIPAGRTRLFVHMLAGGAAATCCGEALVRFVVEPGGGIEIPIGRRTAARVGIGFPVVIAGGGGNQLVRVTGGIVVRLGR
jgi:hypothetical protein